MSREYFAALFIIEQAIEYSEYIVFYSTFLPVSQMIIKGKHRIANRNARQMLNSGV